MIFSLMLPYLFISSMAMNVNPIQICTIFFILRSFLSRTSRPHSYTLPPSPQAIETALLATTPTIALPLSALTTVGVEMKLSVEAHPTACPKKLSPHPRTSEPWLQVATPPQPKLGSDGSAHEHPMTRASTW